MFITVKPVPESSLVGHHYKCRAPWKKGTSILGTSSMPLASIVSNISSIKPRFCQFFERIQGAVSLIPSTCNSQEHLRVPLNSSVNDSQHLKSFVIGTGLKKELVVTKDTAGSCCGWVCAAGREQ